MATIIKSIKEKAIEVFPRHPNANTDYSNFKKRIGFNSGANYVLDAIDDVLSHPRRFVSDDISISEAMIIEITKIVEQLKEK